MALSRPLNFGYLPGYKNLTSAGSGQLDADPLTGGLNVYTDVPAASGVVLPQSYSAFALIGVLNAGANNLNVYPASGAEILTLGVNVPLVVTPNNWTIFVCLDPPISPGQQWWALQPNANGATGIFLSLLVSGGVQLTGLPTSATGLSEGTVYSNGGVLCIA